MGQRTRFVLMPWVRAWFVVALVFMGAVTLAPSSASASGVACASCSGTYTGSWSAQIQNTTPEGTVTYGMSLSWTEMLTTPTGGNGASGVWSLASAQGTVTFTNSGSSSDDCSASLTPNLAVAGDITQFGPQVEEGSAVTVSAHPPTYWSGDPREPLLSSDNTDPGCDFTNELAYESGFWTGFSGASCHYAGPSAADVMSFPVGPTTTITDNCDGQGSDSFGATGTATLTSQLTLTAPGACTCDCPATDRAARQRAHASPGTCCPALALSVNPSTTAVYGRGSTTVALAAVVKQGCPKTYTWSRATQPSGAAVTPKSASGTAVKVTLRCKRGVKICYGEVSYRVTVTDADGKQKAADGFIKWCKDSKAKLPKYGEPCTNPLSEQDYRFKYLWIQHLQDKITELYGEEAAIEAAGHGLAPITGGSSEAGAAGAVGAFTVELNQLRAQLGKALTEFNKDPADPATSEIALPPVAVSLPVPACIPASGKNSAQASQQCAQVRPLFGPVINDTAETSSVVSAMITSANRYATALRGGDQAAVALQQTTTAILGRALAGALQREHDADVSLANGIRTLQLAPLLSATQLNRVVNAVAKLHSFPPEIQPLLGVTPKQFAANLRTDIAHSHTKGLDVPATLSAPIDTAALTAPDPSVTPPSVQAILDVLLSQGEITPGEAQTLGQDLDSLNGATDTSAAQQALASFNATASQISGPAGVFLQAAAGGLAADS
jgi:hypothetical protein